MGEMLTYLNSKLTGFSWTQDQTVIEFVDEVRKTET
jgi:hypothetical protein